MIEYKTLKLDEDTVKDILTTAFEGGIGYWACLGNDDKHWIEQCKLHKERTGEAPYYCDTALNVMLNGHAVILYDEEDDDKKLKMYLDDFMKGCYLFTQEYGSITRKLNRGDFDAIDADMIIQYAVFGEVIYG